ncbi:hypothetical protein EX895_001469 [Sporisorium graminicola]|uniref:Ubinuclein middle domain-containing protein n=1 Tax=Sporisorium graminicola TaxID=280036 RepID=A0A4U7KXW4_9BASI|nr:hypothetical protein EX895_001469 [Sporisorium graminicola]TKY89684.1 hypothetical protein EX895_001469 [Sporisorium graminicola]
MNTRTSHPIIVDDEEMPRSSAASRVSLANLLGPSGPGSSPYANTPRTSPRKRSSADASGSNLQLAPETANGSSNGDLRDHRHSDVSSPQHAATTEPEHEQAFHDAAEHVPEDVLMVDANGENAQENEPEDDDEEEDDDDEDDDEDKATTDAGSASEGEGDGDDKGEGSSSKDGVKSGETAAAPKKRSRRRSPSPPEVVAPPAPKRPSVRIDILEPRQGGYLINVPELVLAKLKEEDHPWAKWYEEQLLQAAEPEPVAPPQAAPEVPPGLEGFGGLAKLLAKYPTAEESGSPSGAGASGASKKRRRPNDDKYDIGQYDVRDPFVDDSELNIDEPTHFAKPKADGFYVTQGPVELAKAKAMGKGQPIPVKDRPKPLSIRDSKFGFAGSLNKLVARKAQQGAELPPMPSTGSPSMQLGSLLNSGDPGSPSVAAASALTNTQRLEGTRDSPIKVDDIDSSSSKLSKKNRYPTLPVDPRLQAAFDELKKKVDAENFAVKTKFPPALKPPLVETAKLAVMLGEYDDNFFNHLPTIFPYNRFTMMKLVKREFFPHHIKYFEDLKQEHLDKLGAMIRDSFPQQLADFEAAHKAWLERGEAPKDGEAAEAIKGPKETNGADESMDVDASKDGEDENVEPTKRWKWTEEMREEVFVLITIENAMSEIRNEKHKLENSAEQYSEINARKACYKQMFELFPEDGWTTSTNISREYAQIKKKKDRQEARGEELFADSRASSAVPA